MNKGWFILGGIGAVLLVIAIALIGANNTANGYEQSIIAANDQSKNVLGQLAPKLREAIGVTHIQTKALVDVVTKANESRYGKQGSAATMQWIQEQNPNFDQSNFTRIASMIEAARNDFADKQKDKIDRIRAYRTALGNFPGGMLMRFLGWGQKSFFDEYGKVIASSHAQDSFATGTDDGVNLNGM